MGTTKSRRPAINMMMNCSNKNHRRAPLFSTIASIIVVGLLLMASMAAAHQQRTSSVRRARGRQLQQTADRNMVEVPMPKRRRAQEKADKSKKSKAAKADPKVLAPAEEDSSVSGRASAQEVTVAIAKSDDDNEDVKDQPKNDKAANSEKPK